MNFFCYVGISQFLSVYWDQNKTHTLLEFFPDFLNYRFWQLVIQMRTLFILVCSLLSYCATKNNFLCLHFLFCFASRQLSATHTRSGQFWPIKNSKTFGNNSSRVRGHFEVTVNRLYLFLAATIPYIAPLHIVLGMLVCYIVFILSGVAAFLQAPVATMSRRGPIWQDRWLVYAFVIS